MARIKARALPVPATREEADALLGQIGADQRAIELIGAGLTEQVAALKAEAAAEAAPIAERLKARFGALHAWAERSRAELLERGRKSVTLSQGLIGWRTGNPEVKIGKDQEDAVVATLGRLGLGQLIRTRQEVDKEAVLREPELVEDVPGIKVEQAESFFAKPLDVKAEQVKTVARTAVRKAGEAA